MRSYDMDYGYDVVGTPAEDEWKLDAACLGADPRIFFPPKGDPGHRTLEAHRLCMTCRVKSDCLAYALKVNDSSADAGIWANTNAQQRKRMRRRVVSL